MSKYLPNPYHNVPVRYGGEPDYAVQELNDYYPMVVPPQRGKDEPQHTYSARVQRYLKSNDLIEEWIRDVPPGTTRTREMWISFLVAKLRDCTDCKQDTVKMAETS